MPTEKKTPIVMTIAGSDSCGGAGVQADLKTFSALGVHGTCVITSVTAQNTKGVQNTVDLPKEMISAQIESIMDEMNVCYAKTGMLSSSKIVKTVRKKIKRFGIPLVVDPVMAAEEGGVLLQDDAINTLILDLLPLATVITPNTYEASILSEIKIKDQKTAKKAAIEISKKGVDSVIITGGHAKDPEMKNIDLIYEGEEKFSFIGGDFIDKSVHGTGCTYSAAICAELAKGKSLYDAASFAKSFVYDSIIKRATFDSFKPIVNQSGKLIENSDRYWVLENVSHAVRIIEKNKSFYRLIPEVGCNVAMAIYGAKKREDVAAVSGRIVKVGESAKAVGCVSFGPSDHISRIILTAMQFDEEKRAAINIKYSKEILSVFGDRGMSISMFNRKKEPKNAKTMDWGTSDAIERFGRVPDVIYDEGGLGKEAMIRVLGCSALEVVEKCCNL